MSNVPKSKRKENRFELLLDASELVGHTEDVCKGQVFANHAYLANMLCGTALEIAMCLNHANRDSMRPGASRQEIEERRRLQDRAIKLCGDMSDLIEIAADVTHRSAKKTATWQEKCRKVWNRAAKWRESDAKRLKSRG